MKINDLKNKFDTGYEKFHSLGKNIWWEIAAYTVRILSCAIPAVVIMYQEHSWQKASLGLLASLVILATVIILYRPIKSLFKLAPGVLPFSVFIIVALLFKTMSDAFLIVGSAGLIGSVLAIPLHYRYLQSLPTTDEMMDLLNKINEKLK